MGGKMIQKFKPNEDEERSSLKEDFDEVPSQMANITFPAIRNSHKLDGKHQEQNVIETY